MYGHNVNQQSIIVRFIRMWMNSIEPNQDLIDETERENARTIASIMLVGAVITLFVLIFRLLFINFTSAEFLRITIRLSAVGVLTLSYSLSLRGRYRQALLFVVWYISVIILGINFFFPGFYSLFNLYYFSLLLFFSSFFLSIPSLILLFTVQSIGILLMPIVNEYVVYKDLIPGPLMFTSLSLIMSVLFTSNRRRIEHEQRERLTRSERRYQHVSELVSDYAFSMQIEANGHIIPEWVTVDAFIDLTGYHPNELGNITAAASLYHPDDFKRATDDIQHAVQGKKTIGDYQILTKDGCKRWLRVTYSPMFGEQGKVIRVLGVGQDITDQKEAEIAQHENEERYKALTNLISGYAFSARINDDGTVKYDWFTYASLARISGYSVEELQSRSDHPIRYHPDDLERARQDLRRTLQGESSVHDYRNLSKDGTIHWIRMYREPIWDETHERVVGFLGVGQDITERKQAEEALRENEERYRIFTETASDYAFSSRVDADLSHEIEWISPSFERVTGYTVDNLDPLMAKPILYHPDDRKLAKGDFDRMVKGNIPITNEYRMIRKDGELRWLQLSRQPIWDENEGRVVRYYGVAQDITKRKQAEEALRLSEERYRFISEMISDFAFAGMIDRHHNKSVEWVTDSFERLTGFTLEELNTPNFSVFHPDDNQRAVEDIFRLFHKSTTKGEYRLVTKKGDPIWLDIERHRVESSDDLVRYYAVAQDITESKRIEEQNLRIAFEQGRLAWVQQFVAAISHDFRTSLSSIETSRYLVERNLQHGSNVEDVYPRLNNIQAEIGRVSDQLDNLNDIASLSDLEKKPVNLNEIVYHLVIQQGAFTKERGLDMIIELDDEMPEVPMDRGALTRAVRHLILNAQNYNRMAGTIRVGTYHDDEVVGVIVEDTGVGIQPDNLERVFELFFREDQARSTTSGGVGLGLSIVKMIAELHSGEVLVESRLGEGSTFTLKIPIKQQLTTPTNPL